MYACVCVMVGASTKGSPRIGSGGPFIHHSFLSPFPPKIQNTQAGQRRRFFLYAGIIAFRTAVLLICLNRLQAHLQGACERLHIYMDWPRPRLHTYTPHPPTHPPQRSTTRPTSP